MWLRVSLVVLLAASCGGSKKEASEPVAGGDGEAGRGRTVPPLDDEDEPDDGVEIEGKRGTLQPGQIQPVISNAGAELEDCFTSNTGKKPYLGGRVELKFRVATDGSVKQVQVANGDLGAWPVEKCILGVAREMTFPSPKGGEAEFSFPIDFPSRAMAMPLDQERAEAELSPRLAELDECGDASQVQVTVYVGVKGSVTSAGFAAPGEQPFTDEWGDCAMSKALSWKLTDPRGRVVKASSWYAP